MRMLSHQALSMSPAAAAVSRPLLYRGDCASDVASAAHALKEGSTIAFPTETVYGLGANAQLTSAVNSIFKAKGRPRDNPLIIHVASLASLSALNLTPHPLHPYAESLAKAFWPGPLTLVLPLSNASKLSPSATAGLKTVAIRVPSHPVAHALLAAAQVPVAAPSANTSGRPSPTRVEHVLDDLSGKIDGVVDGGNIAEEFSVGLESTVVDCTSGEFPRVLRPGAITVDDVFSETGIVVKDCAEDAIPTKEIPKAPGMKYRHYAPRAPVVITQKMHLKREILNRLDQNQGRIGLLADEETCCELGTEFQDKIFTVQCGRKGDVKSVARNLYAGLRSFDCTDVSVIVAVKVEEIGIGKAVMERLRKAASGGVV